MFNNIVCKDSQINSLFYKSYKSFDQIGLRVLIIMNALAGPVFPLLFRNSYWAWTRNSQEFNSFYVKKLESYIEEVVWEEGVCQFQRLSGIDIFVLLDTATC